jgi:hypothetical protein
VGLDVGRAGARAEAAVLVLGEELADEALAEAGTRKEKKESAGALECGRQIRATHADGTCEVPGLLPGVSGKGMSSRKMFANVPLRFLPLKGVVPYSIS